MFKFKRNSNRLQNETVNEEVIKIEQETTT